MGEGVGRLASEALTGRALKVAAVIDIIHASVSQKVLIAFATFSIQVTGLCAVEVVIECVPFAALFALAAV